MTKQLDNRMRSHRLNKKLGSDFKILILSLGNDVKREEAHLIRELSKNGRDKRCLNRNRRNFPYRQKEVYNNLLPSRMREGYCSEMILSILGEYGCCSETCYKLWLDSISKEERLSRWRLVSLHQTNLTILHMDKKYEGMTDKEIREVREEHGRVIGETHLQIADRIIRDNRHYVLIERMMEDVKKLQINLCKESILRRLEDAEEGEEFRYAELIKQEFLFKIMCLKYYRERL